VSITTETWFAARSRVLARNAEAAAGVAKDYRAKVGTFPGDAAELLRLADKLDRYAAECRAAAGDPSLPTPTYESTDTGQGG
jgi:hypothetical protein